MVLKFSFLSFSFASAFRRIFCISKSKNTVVFSFRRCKVRNKKSPHEGLIFYRPTNRPTFSEIVRQTVRLPALSPQKSAQKPLYYVLSSQSLACFWYISKRPIFLKNMADLESYFKITDINEAIYDTLNELNKMEQVRNYLISNQAIDADGFVDFLSEL